MSAVRYCCCASFSGCATLGRKRSTLDGTSRLDETCSHLKFEGQIGDLLTSPRRIWSLLFCCDEFSVFQNDFKFFLCNQFIRSSGRQPVHPYFWTATSSSVLLDGRKFIRSSGRQPIHPFSWTATSSSVLLDGYEFIYVLLNFEILNPICDGLINHMCCEF